MKECIEKLESTGDYRIIKRFTPVAQYCTHTPKDTKVGIYLDTETTGINPNKEEIIELAMVPFEFDSLGKIYRILPEYNAFQDPRRPIPEMITQITGITDEMVSGEAIDVKQVTNMLEKAVLVVAHNAKFDRQFVEKLSDSFERYFLGMFYI